ncbi:hypothetical protein [Nocardia goodfellowii]|uniref:Uncharacterized protein n=1 Tax=Nocardia goodfellowii TaxID=882446 RepID=A0ABS4QJY1_9NOCA|nr:hypothetical protein [Nocardia goodfellowii]MBP2191435.1 hypothetical protein [Nocardia goodfellowii]
MDIEMVEIVDGAGVIDVRGDSGVYGIDSQNLLYLGGVAAAIDMADLRGSISRLFVRAPDRVPRPEQLQALRVLTVSGHSSGALAETLRPLLALMANGRYELRPPIPVTNRISEGFQAWSGSGPDRWGVSCPGPDEPDWTYPEEEWLTPTEAWPPADTATVDRYREVIRQGERPVVITLRAGAENYWSGFVLDGHHKLAAYRAEEVAPVVLRIARADPPPITAAQIRWHFPRAAEHWRLQWVMAALDRREGES